MAYSRFLKQIGISFGIIVVCIAAAAAGIYYFVNDLSTQADAIINDRAMIQQQTNSVAELATLQHDLPLATQYQSAMDQLLPDPFGLVTFGQWFSQVGQKYNVTANAELNGAPPVAGQGSTPGTAGFSFDVEGSPSDVVAFLQGASTKSSGFIFSIASFDYTYDGTNARVAGAGTLFSR